MRNKILRLDNLGLGMRRDGVMKQEYMYSLYTMKNYEIDYTEGKLRIRPGYDRWNTVALPYPVTQLFWFNDMSGNENLLGVVGGSTDAWYKISETGAHTNICAHAVTSRRPAIQFGSRAFIGTDKDITEVSAGGNGLQWVDNTSIGTGTSYRVGIKPPDEPPNVDVATPIGHTITVTGNNLYLNTTTQRKIGFTFTTTEDMKLGSMKLSVFRPSTLALGGNVRIKIYTNVAGSPSSTIVNDDAVSNWWPVAMMPIYGVPLANSVKLFTFGSAFDLPAGTYWAVLESDPAYRANYVNGGGFTFYCIVGSDAPTPPDYGFAKFYNDVTETWVATAYEPYFYVGGLDVSKFYDYVITYYNSDYLIESRKSDYTRIDPTTNEPITQITLPTPTDSQVDIIRVYRREHDNVDDTESSITDTYKYIDEGEAGDIIVDTIPTENLGAELQTNDHYCIDETDDEGTMLREAEIHPNIMALWKGRIWMSESNGNIIYMTKRLEEDGATGLTGDPIPDYVPLENKVIIESEGAVIGMKALPSDELAVYMSDSTIWALSGANMLLNPPPDIAKRRVGSDVGLVASQGLVELRGRHLFMSRTGIYAFTGLSTVEKLSGNIQSILDDISNTYIDDSIFIAFGDELWALVDDDNDGALNSFFIMDLGRDPVTWRWYDYGVDLNDVIIRKTGADYNSILAADAGSKYILQLNNGTTDKGSSIVGEIQLHRIRGRNRMILTRVSIDDYYPSTAPTYAITVIGPTGTEYAYTLSPSVSTDIRKHSVGVRVPADPEAWVKIQQTSGGQDEILSIEVEGTEM